MNELTTASAAAPVVTAQTTLTLLRESAESLELAYAYAEKVCQTDMVPPNYKGKPYDAAVAIQRGLEIGLQPLQALDAIACINNRVTVWGDALVALVRGSGLCEYINAEWDDENSTAIVRTKRTGEPEHISSFSLNEARIAGLTNKDTYSKYPRRMLTNRARAFALRDVYADVIKGFKIREVEEEDSQAVPVKDITPAAKELDNLINNETPAIEAPDVEASLDSIQGMSERAGVPKATVDSALVGIAEQGRQMAASLRSKMEPVEEQIEIDHDATEELTPEFSGLYYDYLAKLDECSTLRELTACAKEMSVDNSLTNEETESLRAVYGRKQMELR